MIDSIEAAEWVAVDTETTGLNPRQDRLRLLQIGVPGQAPVVIDTWKEEWRHLLPILARKTLIGHNLAFDLGFLGIEPAAPPFDTMIAAQVLEAGVEDYARGIFGLGDVVQRYLGVTLDKSKQRSDWSGDLTREQLEYAAKDAEVLLPLAECLRRRLQAEGLWGVFQLEMAALPTISWMTRVGAPFDPAAWANLGATAKENAEMLWGTLSQTAGSVLMPGKKSGRKAEREPGYRDINWRSSAQVLHVLKQAGLPLESTREMELAKHASHPLIKHLLSFREQDKLSTTYSERILGYVDPWDGRIHGGVRQCGTVSGRLSCAEPNLQQIPRHKAYRACFKAPAGRLLVKCDYSQIELRVAAEIAGDATLINAYRAGRDVHAMTAASVLGVDLDSLSVVAYREARQKAKAVNFGFLYGMGWLKFVDYARSSYGVEFTPEEARHFKNRWAALYPGVTAWHRRQPEMPITTFTKGGRRRLSVERFSEKLNTPVQGTAADGMKRALAEMWGSRNQHPGISPVLCVHDELVVEAPEDRADEAVAWVRQCMIDGMTPYLDIVPVEVETAVGVDWAGNGRAA